MQKHVNLVDLVKSFPTNIFLQNLASIQKRTSPIKFAHLAEKSENGSISNLSTKVLTLAHGDWVFSVAWDPAGARLATGCNDNTARVFDGKTGEEVLTLAHDGPVYSVAWDPAGARLATGCGDRTARVFDGKTGEVVLT